MCTVLGCTLAGELLAAWLRWQAAAGNQLSDFCRDIFADTDSYSDECLEGEREGACQCPGGRGGEEFQVENKDNVQKTVV